MLDEMRDLVERSHCAGEPSPWTRLGCSRCRYVSEHPGPVTPGDLDRRCAPLRGRLGAVTVFRVNSVLHQPAEGRKDYESDQRKDDRCGNDRN
jgi:hypothetical protein